MLSSALFPLLRRVFVALTLGIAPLWVAQAYAHGVTLVVHHYLPADSAFHTQFLVPWTQKLEKESAGLLRFRFYPALQMGGDAAQLADQVADRSVDIVLTLTRHNPGRYPAMEAFEVTAIKHGAQGASRAAWEYVRLNDLADKDFDEVRLLAVSLSAGPSADLSPAVGLLMLNGRSYKALTETLRKVINDNSGAGTSAWLANTMSEKAASAVTPTQDAMDTWIKEATKRGLNAKALAESARALMAEYDTLK